MLVRRTTSLLAACFAVPMLLTACGNESTPVATAPTTSAVAATIEEVAASTTAEATTTAAPSPALHGKILAAQVCQDSLEYFQGLEELAKEFGEPYDPDEAAAGLIDLARTGGEEFMKDLEASGMEIEPVDPNEPTWEQLPAADRAQIEAGIRAAANNDC